MATGKPITPPQSCAKSVGVLETDGDEPLAHPIHVARERVVALCGGLVRAAEADEVGRDHAVPVRREAGDDLAIQVRPRRVAVHEHDRRRAARALVYVVHAQRGAVLRLHLRVVRREGVAVELLEAGVGVRFTSMALLLRARGCGRRPAACDPRACPGRRARAPRVRCRAPRAARRRWRRRSASRRSPMRCERPCGPQSLLRFTICAGAKKNSGFGPGRSLAAARGRPVRRADRAVVLQLVAEVVVDRATSRRRRRPCRRTRSARSPGATSTSSYSTTWS